MYKHLFMTKVFNHGGLGKTLWEMCRKDVSNMKLQELVARNEVLDIFKEAVSFHIGDIENIPIPKSVAQLHLPYETMWVDGRCGNTDGIESSPVGWLITSNPTFITNILTGHEIDFGVLPNAVCIVFSLVDHGKYRTPLNSILSLTRHDGATEIRMYEPTFKLGKYLQVKGYGELHVPERSSTPEQLLGIIAPALTTIELLTCKNIKSKFIQVSTTPSVLKVSKSRQYPKQDYNILTIQLPKKIRNIYTNLPKEIPFHTAQTKCETSMKMGHFKTFTEDRPLFGKYTGTWWWQPQFNGKIDKVYILKLAENTSETDIDK